MKGSIGDTRSVTAIPSRRVTSLPRLVLSACLVGAIAPLGGGPALGQDLASGIPDPAAWSEWLQQHRQLEYPAGASVAAAAWPDAITVAGWLQDHLELEYPGSQRV
jgi:hypothetical protein